MERIRGKDFENTQSVLRQSIASGVGGGMAWNGYMNVAQHNHKKKHQRFDGGLKNTGRTSSSQMTCQKLGYPLVIKHGVLENVPSLYSIGTLW